MGMKVVIFGATGMVGQGALRECLLSPEVESVLVVGRSSIGQQHAKLREILRPDVTDLGPVEDQLAGLDACLFCLGTTSVGKKEDEYRRLTYDLTIAVANVLVRRSPGLTFIYVSGASTDSTAKGSVMWARVKGETENALLAMPFKAAYMFRPGYIHPMHGLTSKTLVYRLGYVVAKPLYPIFRRLTPNAVTNSEALGRAMIRVAAHGAPKPHVENADINELGRAG